ncbi:MAG TPA: cobyrinate a,c-diamide synthase [Edaphobacter sp.]|nr:cobyrinate a,c-diamide synthase [Edaphobacter sp.]
MKGLLIAGTASGVGKTTVALAIMAGLRRRGLAVQPFKCGPDFLDTGHHTRICGRTARNLDTWMLSVEANRSVLRNAARGADVIVAEGMMGLFDGKSGATEIGSSAEIAKLLKLPVVLVVDAAKSARSVAAVLLGFEMFDAELRLAGVILNRVAGARHYEMLRQAIESYCKTKILGWLPVEPAIAIPERHLGLHGAAERDANAQESVLDAFASLAEKHLELDGLLDLECGVEMAGVEPMRINASAFVDAVRVGVPSDHAFSFYYEDNLDLLREQGVEIVRFSPMTDVSLPPSLDGLYLGGGYPELHAKQLSGNRQMLEDVRTFAASGRPVYAECGGMLYLSESLSIDEGSFAMAGVLPLSMQMTDRLVQFGYVTVEFTEDCLLGRKGTVVRGHSFHHTRITSQGDVATNYHVQYSMSGAEELEGFRQGNVLASYIHVHFRANPAVAENFVSAIRQARTLQAVTA